MPAEMWAVTGREWSFGLSHALACVLLLASLSSNQVFYTSLKFARVLSVLTRTCYRCTTAHVCVCNRQGEPRTRFRW